MSRSGYSYDIENWDLIRWRGAVESAIRGRRGQAFLREMVAALDAMPDKRLGRGALVDDAGCPCAMGSVALARGLDIPPPPRQYDPDDWGDSEGADQAAALLGIAGALAKEIAFLNDEDGTWRKHNETPEQRWAGMRKWAQSQIRADSPSPPTETP